MFVYLRKRAAICVCAYIFACVCACVEERVQTCDVCEWRQRAASSAGGEGAWPASLPYKALCCPGIGVPLVVVRSDLGCNTVRARPHHPPAVTMATPPFPRPPLSLFQLYPGHILCSSFVLVPVCCILCTCIVASALLAFLFTAERCGPALNTS